MENTSLIPTSFPQIHCVTRGPLENDPTKNVGPLNEFSINVQRNTFKANFPITLVGLGFFGPVFGERKQFANYKVDYEIIVSLRKPKYFVLYLSNGECNHVFGRGKANICTKDEKFYVDLGNVNIPANMPTEIAFTLEGPPTGRLSPVVLSHNVETEKGNIEFTFQSGSAQMPDLYFTVYKEAVNQHGRVEEEDSNTV